MQGTLKDNNKLTVLVTGGAGFIGSHLTDALLAAGHQVRVLDNLSNGRLANLEDASAKPHFTFVEGDILDQETVGQVMDGVDFVFHLACLGVRHSIHSPFMNHRVNAEGSLNILQAARENKVKHFFYISTSEIYGRTSEFPIRESAPTQPLTVYGSSKLAGEHYARSYHECYGLPVTIFRIFNNYGPRAHHEGDAGEIIPRSIVKMLYGERPVIFGDGSITRDFFYVKDTARVLCLFLDKVTGGDQEMLTGKVINIGTGSEITMKTLLETLASRMGGDKGTIEYMPDRPADVPRLWVDTSLFRSLMDFRSGYDLERGLDETIAYFRDQAAKRNLLENIKLINWAK